MGRVESYDDVVVKSPMDRRSYRILHLDNGLSALLVHDPEIYPDGCKPRDESETPTNAEEGDGEEYDDEDGSDLEGDDEEGTDEEEEENEGEGDADGDGSEPKKKKKKGASPTKKNICFSWGALSIQMKMSMILAQAMWFIKCFH